ncbi:MAG: hypothetical protein FJ290_27200 [Planctomycetes bacterium]|nr:hypothetical protein [Planctomycetota bacterium]
MTEAFADLCVERLGRLQKLMGRTARHEILDPFPLDPHDPIALQAAAKRIADFIGLRGRTIVVVASKLADRQGGRIEIEPGQDTVFVDVSVDALGFPTAVLATLAHEVTHKHMQVEGMTPGVLGLWEGDYEVLTDIAGVFLGLGKLMLQGADCQAVSEEPIPGGVRRTTTTLKTGYLGLEQLAFAYLFVCAMRGIPSSVCEAGLFGKPLTTLHACQRQYGRCMDRRFAHPDIREQLADVPRKPILEAQEVLARIDRDLLYLQAACVQPLDAFLDVSHKRLRDMLARLRALAADDEVDPCLRFIGAVRLDREMEGRAREARDLSREAARHQRALEPLTSGVQRQGAPFADPAAEVFTVVKCRHDGTKLRVRENKPRVVVHCPQCDYHFAADTTPPRLPRAEAGERSPWWRRLWGFLRRGRA